MMRTLKVVETVHYIFEPDAPCDEREWRVRVLNGELLVEAWNDARSMFTSTVIKRRGATITDE